MLSTTNTRPGTLSHRKQQGKFSDTVTLRWIVGGPYTHACYTCRSSMAQHDRDRPILQNGYALQHYRPANNDLTDPLRRWVDILLRPSDSEFDSEVQRARQMVASPVYQYSQRQQRPHPLTYMGLPTPPNMIELIALGDRAHALAKIEEYKQQYATFVDRMDPGGRMQERQLELMDRRHTEYEKKHRKGDGGRCCAVQ